ncbi:MAG: hypothetical protein H6Q71_2780 [Firmicutes bacterium]|nr:hypothetical protein [Bacillota bacterium]
MSCTSIKRLLLSRLYPYLPEAYRIEGELMLIN